MVLSDSIFWLEHDFCGCHNTREALKLVKELCIVQFCSPMLCLVDEIECSSTEYYGIMAKWGVNLWKGRWRGHWQCGKFGCCERTFLWFIVDHTAKCDNSHMVNFVQWSLLVDAITVTEMFVKELSQFSMKLKCHVG